MQRPPCATLDRVRGAVACAIYLAKIKNRTAVPMSDIAIEPKQPSRLLKNSNGPPSS